jgi:hypothetical protein
MGPSPREEQLNMGVRLMYWTACLIAWLILLPYRLAVGLVNLIVYRLIPISIAFLSLLGLMVLIEVIE